MDELLMGRGKSPRIVSKPRRRQEPTPERERPGRHCVVCLKAKAPGTFPICPTCRTR